MTVACYVRVSTHGQNRASQVAVINTWLEGHGISDPTWYTDAATGDNLHRPDFARLQRDVFNGQVKTIVVFKLDRISRSLRDGINTLCGWLDAGVRVVSVSQQFDFAGTTGKLIASVLFAVAEMEQETRRERQAAGIAVAKKAGRYMGRKQGTTKGSTERAKELTQQGLSVAEVARSLGVSRQTVYRYLGE